MVDTLSHVASKLNAEAVTSILEGVSVWTTGRADAHDPSVAEADERIHKQVEETAVQAWAIHMCVNLHVMDWVAAQEDPILKIAMEWISTHNVQDLKHLLGTTPQQKRVWPSFVSGRNSHSIRVPSTTTISQLESWRKLCGL